MSVSKITSDTFKSVFPACSLKMRLKLDLNSNWPEFSVAYNGMWDMHT
jgi:hypothetical protein